MSACNEWQERLLDHALGQAAGAELEAHLASCAACSRALDDLRARAGLLDAGVRQAVGVEPPAGLAARIVARASLQRAKPAQPWRWRVAAAVFVTAAALAVLAYLRGVSRAREWGQLSAAAATLSGWRSPTESLLHSPSQEWLGHVPSLGKGYFEIMSRQDMRR